MLDYLIDLDKQVLLFFNGSNSPYLDRVMWVFTGRLIWLPLVLSLVFVFTKRSNWREALFVILTIVVVATLCDQISSSFFKPMFARFRPSQDPELADLVKVVNNYRGGRYGFISSHAANSAGVVMITSLIFRARVYTISVFIWAAINCYTRLYLGVHFPGDILAGFALGLIIALLFYLLYSALRVPLSKNGILKGEQSPYAHVSTAPVLYVLYGTYLFILVYALF